MKITSLLPLVFSIAAVAGVVLQVKTQRKLLKEKFCKTAAPAHLENVDEIFSGWTFELMRPKPFRWTTLIIHRLFL